MVFGAPWISGPISARKIDRVLSKWIYCAVMWMAYDPIVYLQLTVVPDRKYGRENIQFVRFFFFKIKTKKMLFDDSICCCFRIVWHTFRLHQCGKLFEHKIDDKHFRLRSATHTLPHKINKWKYLKLDEPAPETAIRAKIRKYYFFFVRYGTIDDTNTYLRSMDLTRLCSIYSFKKNRFALTGQIFIDFYCAFDFEYVHFIKL